MDPRVVQCLDNLNTRIGVIETNVDQIVLDATTHRKVTMELIRLLKQTINYVATSTVRLDTLQKNLEN